VEDTLSSKAFDLKDEAFDHCDQRLQHGVRLQ